MGCPSHAIRLCAAALARDRELVCPIAFKSLGLRPSPRDAGFLPHSFSVSRPPFLPPNLLSIRVPIPPLVNQVHLRIRRKISFSFLANKIGDQRTRCDVFHNAMAFFLARSPPECRSLAVALNITQVE